MAKKASASSINPTKNFRGRGKVRSGYNKMNSKRRTLWLAMGATVLLAILAACLLLDNQPFDPQQVTAKILGYGTNAGQYVVLVRVNNNCGRALRHDNAVF